MPELRKGDAVMVWGLVNRADLNKFCGVVTHPLAPGGAFATRIGVKVFNNNATESVRVKPENLLPIGKDGKVTLPNGTEVLPTKIVPATEPTMGIGEGTDDDPFAGLKQHMQAAGFDPSGCQTFSMKPGAHGTGATLEECLANAQASTEPKTKYNDNRNPPPVRAATRDEALGPNPCAGLCPDTQTARPRGSSRTCSTRSTTSRPACRRTTTSRRPRAGT